MEFSHFDYALFEGKGEFCVAIEEEEEEEEDVFVGDLFWPLRVGAHQQCSGHGGFPCASLAIGAAQSGRQALREAQNCSTGGTRFPQNCVLVKRLYFYRFFK